MSAGSYGPLFVSTDQLLSRMNYKIAPNKNFENTLKLSNQRDVEVLVELKCMSKFLFMLFIVFSLFWSDKGDNHPKILLNVLRYSSV